MANPENRPKPIVSEYYLNQEFYPDQGIDVNWDLY
jgi:hypothetical protein